MFLTFLLILFYYLLFNDSHGIINLLIITNGIINKGVNDMAKKDFSDLFPVTTKKAATKRARRKSGASLAAGIAAGAAVGAVAGILLAPKSGKETREDIKFKTGEVATKVKDSTKRTIKVVKEKLAKKSDDPEATVNPEDITQE